MGTLPNDFVRMLTLVPVSGRASDSKRLLLKVVNPVASVGLGQAAAMHMVAHPANTGLGHMWSVIYARQRRWSAPCIKDACKARLYLPCRDPVHTQAGLRVHQLSQQLEHHLKSR